MSRQVRRIKKQKKVIARAASKTSRERKGALSIERLLVGLMESAHI